MWLLLYLLKGLYLNHKFSSFYLSIPSPVSPRGSEKQQCRAELLAEVKPQHPSRGSHESTDFWAAGYSVIVYSQPCSTSFNFAKARRECQTMVTCVIDHFMIMGCTMQGRHLFKNFTSLDSLALTAELLSKQ